MNTRFLYIASIRVHQVMEEHTKTYIPVVSMLLYAYAAAGPEYEYPACL